MTHLPLFDKPRAKPDPLNRKVTQYDRVRSVMLDGTWHTLAGIRNMIDLWWHVMDSEAAISARLRDMRNQEGFMVDCRLVAKGRRQREYRATKG